MDDMTSNVNSGEVYGSDFRSVPLVAELGERLAAWHTVETGACGG